MPPVEIVDMREADPRAGVIHQKTLDALGAVRREGGKAIVMINRRGFAPWLICRTCGHHWGCPNCDVSLIVHRESDQLICHHCSHSEPLPRRCGECGGSTLAQSGAGTQRIERLLAEAMSPMPVFRLDADTSAGPGGHGRVLGAFDRADSAILVGTQMVAKGHDFPEVTLSVILDADATLRFPDFRAEERTFSLVTQLAGRSGRGEAGGRVIVQTLAPDAASIRAARSTTPPVSSRVNWSAGVCSPTRHTPSCSGSRSQPRKSRPSTAPRPKSPSDCRRCFRKAPRCSGRLRCSAPATAIAAGC